MKLAAALASVVALAFAGCGGGSDTRPEAQAASADANVPFDTSEFATDFTKHSVPLDEFIGGGPPKDGIPSIDEPRFVEVGKADDFLAPREPVAVVEVAGEAKAYPLQILVWHEIVNDEIGGEPIAVTYCPLCNATVAFKREVDGEAVDFGTTGMLRDSDLVMYDRKTESWWQQLTAEAVVGELTGTDLEIVPSQILAWEDVQEFHPDAAVLSRDTGFDRDYGSTPYASYDSDPNSQPFLLDSETDRSLPPKERVAAVAEAGSDTAVVYPYSRLVKKAPVNDEISGTPVVVLFDPDVASALDASAISDSREVGSAAVFERAVGGRELEFRRADKPGTFRDVETASTWAITGEAIAGELEGEQLERIPHDDQFWFAVAAFFEDPEIRG